MTKNATDLHTPLDGTLTLMQDWSIPMTLPNMSYMMTVGELRYIQATLETADYRNPDRAVGAFLPLSKKLRCVLRAMLFSSRLRRSPFYSYVLARTRYYDQVFTDALERGCAWILNLGCGGDTRAYRFAPLLQQKGVMVAECDQGPAIDMKQQIARRHWSTSHVRYLAIDLNQRVWPAFEALLDEIGGKPILVMLEGVSPYVDADSFEAFLDLLGRRLAPESTLAYDYKLEGVADSFGAQASGQRLYRLPAERARVADLHRRHGFDLTSMELSSQLSTRLGPSKGIAFNEDCLLQLRVSGQ